MIDAKSSIVSKTPQTISDCQKKWNFIELSSSLKWKVPKTSLTHHDRKNKFLMDLCFQKGTWRQSFLVLIQSLHSRTFSFWSCPYLWKRWKCKWDCTIHILALFSFSRLNHAIFCFYPQCKPYHFSDKVLIIGDAAHAMVPFFGQGMNSVSSSMSFLIFVIMYDRYRTFGHFQMWC